MCAESDHRPSVLGRTHSFRVCFSAWRFSCVTFCDIPNPTASLRNPCDLANSATLGILLSHFRPALACSADQCDTVSCTPQGGISSATLAPLLRSICSHHSPEPARFLYQCSCAGHAEFRLGCYGTSSTAATARGLPARICCLPMPLPNCGASQASCIET